MTLNELSVLHHVVVHKLFAVLGFVVKVTGVLSHNLYMVIVLFNVVFFDFMQNND